MPIESKPTARPRIECDRQHPLFVVTDLEGSIAFYRDRLGFELAFTWGDPPSFAGVNLDQVQVFLQKGTPGPDGCSVSFVVGDADELAEFHRRGGVEFVEEIDDREYGLRDYSVRDPDGYRLSFGHYIYSVGPPIEIERVGVPVRLERRLAALLADLAQYRHMAVSECLEEILLHTCEPLGDGVASPHTQRTLRHIQELKDKHGIDYDTHRSYRFVEKPEDSRPVASGQ